MIKLIRKYSNSKIAQILLGLLGLTFIFLWGIGDVITRFTVKDYIIKIGDEKISSQQFNAYFAANDKLMQKLDIKDASIKRKLVVEKTLQDLTTKAIFDIFEKENNLLFNGSVVAFALSKDERFLDKQNAFDKNKLRSLIATQNNSEEMFIESYGESLKMMFLNMLCSSYKINDFYASKLLESQHERRYIEIKIFKPTDYTVSTDIAKETLEKFYEKKSYLFDVPELRTVEYIYIDKSKVNIKPTEEQLKQEFQKRVKAGEYFESEFETVKNDIAFDVEDDLNYGYLENTMKEIEAGLKQGKTLEELSAKHDFIVFKRATFSKDNKDDSGNIVITETFKEILLSAAFDTNKINQASDFIDTDDGGELMFTITNIQKPYTKSFEEVEEKLKSLYIVEQLDTRAKNAAAEYTDKINTGNMTEQIGTEYSYVRSDINTNLKNLDKSAFIKIFELTTGKASYAKVGNDYVVIKLKETRKPDSHFVYERLDTFKKAINKQIVSDLVEQFMYFSQKKYKVDVNTRALRME